MKLERLIILLILSTIAFSLGSLSILKVKASEAVYGDFDKDNDFDSDDYALLRQFLLGMIAFELAPVTADVDGNSRLDSDDYAYMKQHLLGMINKFPVETREEVKSTLEPTPKPSGKIKGDLNKDGYLTPEDFELYKKVMAPIETPYPMDIIRVGDLTMNDLDMDDDGDLDSDDQAYLYIINTWNFAAVRNLTSLMNFFLANYCCIIYNLII